MLTLLAAQSQPAPHIVLDGDFTDWGQVPVASHDPADAPTSIVDFKDVRIAGDDRYIYVQADFWKPISVQSLSAGSISILVDEDGNTATGQTVKGAPGIDLVMEMGQGVAVRKYPTPPAKPVDVALNDSDCTFAPRFGSPRFEFRLDREATRHATVKLVFDQGGSIRDETETMPVDLPVRVLPVAPSPNERVPANDPLRRADGTALRVVIWNVSGLSKIDRGPFLRVLRAINADIVMLDEADPRRPAADIPAWLNAIEAGKTGPVWHAILGRAFQGTVVAAKGEVSSAFDRIPYPRGTIEAWTAPFAPDVRPMWRTSLEESGVGTTGALAIVGGRRILAMPVDLASGGGPGSERDAQRILETTAMAAAARGVLPTIRADAVLIGGDFNLVGSHDPIDVLLNAGLDVDGSSLADARALSLDGRTNATWRGLGGGRFTPGRLDWMLYSDSALQQTGGFVFDTAALSPYWLSQHHLLADDSTSTSDHLPVVADFRWKR